MFDYLQNSSNIQGNFKAGLEELYPVRKFEVKIMFQKAAEPCKIPYIVQA